MGDGDTCCRLSGLAWRFSAVAPTAWLQHAATLLGDVAGTCRSPARIGCGEDRDRADAWAPAAVCSVAFSSKRGLRTVGWGQGRQTVGHRHGL